MRFKQFLEFSIGDLTAIPADPSSFWKLPSMNPSRWQGTGLTGLFYRLNQKQQLEMRTLEKLAMKSEQLVAAINTPSADQEHFFPNTYKLINDKKIPETMKPRVNGQVIQNIALDDIRKTTGGGGYHQALMPYEYKYAEDKKILVPHQNNDGLGDFYVSELRKTMTNFFGLYHGRLQVATWADKAINLAAGAATQSVNGYGMTKSATGMV